MSNFDIVFDLCFFAGGLIAAIGLGIYNHIITKEWRKNGEKIFY